MNVFNVYKYRDVPNSIAMKQKTLEFICIVCIKLACCVFAVFISTKQKSVTIKRNGMATFQVLQNDLTFIYIRNP